MNVKYIQLVVTSLKCIRRTSRAYLGPFVLETDPDSIDVATTFADGQHGTVVTYPTIFLGNQYTEGKEEFFTPPKVISEVCVRGTDTFPRMVNIGINMAEKDDGGGFNHLVDAVSSKLAEELEGWVQRETSGIPYEDIVTTTLQDTVRNLLKSILNEIGNALGLGDDPYRTESVTLNLANYNQAPPSTPITLTFQELKQAEGQFLLTCQFRESSSSALVPADSIGRSSEALSTETNSSNPYTHSSGRLFRFASPLPPKNRLELPPGVRFTPVDIQWLRGNLGRIWTRE